MIGRTALVTGATSGIGRETARGLAARGARVFLVARDRRRGEATAAEIAADTGNAAVEVLVADLSALREVRRLVAELGDRTGTLHVLVNAAGTVVGERELTEDGLERTFATNHLAVFLLTNLLLDPLRAGGVARIVTVVSDIHRQARLDVGSVRGEGRYSPLRAYAQSKLANVLFTLELARRLEGSGLTATCVHPGLVRTNLGRSTTGLFGLANALALRAGTTPRKGAEAPLHLATAPELEGVTGTYFSRQVPRPPSKRARDPQLAARLWTLSEELTGLVPAHA